MQSSQNQTTGTGQSTTLPSWLTSGSQQAVDIGSQVASRAYEGYDGTTVAPLSGNEQTAYNMAGTMAGQAQSSGLTSQANMAYTPSNVAQIAQPYVQGVIQPQLSALNQQYDQGKTALNSNSQSVAAQNAYDTQGNAKNNTALDSGQTAATGNVLATGAANAYNYGQQALISNQAQAAGITNNIGQDLSSSGNTAQSINQAQNTFYYGQYLENQNWSTNNMQSLLSAIKGAQVNTSSTGTGAGAQSQNNTGSMIGAAASIAGTIASFY
jgi:hypothetical protein